MRTKRAKRRRKEPLAPWPRECDGLPPGDVLEDLSRGDERSYREWLRQITPARQKSLFQADAQQTSHRRGFRGKANGRAASSASWAVTSRRRGRMSKSRSTFRCVGACHDCGGAG